MKIVVEIYLGQIYRAITEASEDVQVIEYNMDYGRIWHRPVIVNPDIVSVSKSIADIEEHESAREWAENYADVKKAKICAECKKNIK